MARVIGSVAVLMSGESEQLAVVESEMEGYEPGRQRDISRNAAIETERYYHTVAITEQVSIISATISSPFTSQNRNGVT